MAKPRTPKPKTSNKPKQENVRRTSQPKSKEEQVQAIADDIKSELVGFILRERLAQQVTVESVRIALGRGGNKLDEFLEEYTSGYKRAVPGNQLATEIQDEKKNEPELKQVSRDASLNLGLPTDKNSPQTGKTTPKPKPKKK